MPGAPLIGKVATPDFNILGAILGGPRYMSSYLASKDAAAQQQQQMGMNADYAQQLIKRPDFQGAFQPRGSALCQSVGVDAGRHAAGGGARQIR